MNLAFAYTHSPIDFYFKQSPRDFVVEEIPLYPFSDEGVHLVLKIRKKNLTTFDLLKILSTHLGVKEKEIGYAGLKDKNSLSIQHVSLPISVKSKLESFNHANIKILESTLHNNKLKIGHLKGNKFFIRIKKLDKVNAQKAMQVFALIERFGIPNYFAHQRFGIDGANYLEGKAIIEGKKHLRNKKLQNFLISAYQSYLFNQWLSCRITFGHIIDSHAPKDIYKALQMYFKDIPSVLHSVDYCLSLKNQPHFFRLVEGDCMCHYPFGRNFFLESNGELTKESQRFLAKQTAPTGLLSGSKVVNVSSVAGFFESQFMDSRILSAGMRRYAWIFPENLKFTYKEEEAQGEISFFLPKGAYATNLLRELAHREISFQDENLDV